MHQLKVSFIGCGKHAKANIYPSVQVLGVPIDSVCARHMERAEATGRQYNANKAYDDYREMLAKNKPDAVFVITSGDQHATIVQDCLRAGVHVFVEKPLGWNAPEAARVAELSAQVGKYVMVGFMKRFAPSYRVLKQLMSDENNFGEPLSLAGMFGMRSFGPDIESYLKFNAIHYIDLIRYLFGEVRGLTGFSRTPDAGVAQVLAFISEKGQIGTLFFAGLPSWERHYEELTITGTRGYAKVENMTKVVYHLQKEVAKNVPRWQAMDEEQVSLASIDTSSSGGWQTLYLNGYVGEIKHFLDSVAEDQEPICSAADNVRTMALCDRILGLFKDSATS